MSSCLSHCFSQRILNLQDFLSNCYCCFLVKFGIRVSSKLKTGEQLVLFLLNLSYKFASKSYRIFRKRKQAGGFFLWKWWCQRPTWVKLQLLQLIVEFDETFQNLLDKFICTYKQPETLHRKFYQNCAFWTSWNPICL